VSSVHAHNEFVVKLPRGGLLNPQILHPDPAIPAVPYGKSKKITLLD
jgi:hypothetical protein